jgi:hypothetical protein
MDDKKDIELRSEKVRNIVGQIPPILLRRGITIISFILLSLFVSAYFIPYPETIHLDIQLQDVSNSEKIKGTAHCSPLIKSKLKEEQTISLELSGYPASIFGLIEGQILIINPIPESDISDQPLFKIEISFPRELKTSYNKIIPYFPQMKGTGTILLSNETILKRFITSITNN